MEVEFVVGALLLHHPSPHCIQGPQHKDTMESKSQLNPDPIIFREVDVTCPTSILRTLRPLDKSLITPTPGTVWQFPQRQLMVLTKLLRNRCSDPRVLLTFLPAIPSLKKGLYLFIYGFNVTFTHCTGHITMGSFVGR